jgi:hypothetical protein
MLLGSLKKDVIERLLGEQDRYEIIEKLLKQANGDVDRALALSRCRDQYGRSAGDNLGNIGSCGPGRMGYRIRGSAPGNKVEVWMPESKITAVADFEIAWDEVFEYVLYDSDLDLQRQLRLEWEGGSDGYRKL